MKLRDLMIPNVVTTTPDATVAEAARLMGQKAIGAIVVVQNGNVAGILTERDILNKIAAEGKDTRQTRVRDIMTSPVLTLAPADDIEKAIQIMGEKKIRRLPITEGGRLVGILTSTDVLLNLKRELVALAESAESTLAEASASPAPGMSHRVSALPVLALFGIGVALLTWGTLGYSFLSLMAASPMKAVELLGGWTLGLAAGALFLAASLVLFARNLRRFP